MIAVTVACRGCGACLLTCPERAIRPALPAPPGAGPLTVLGDRCTGCGECAEVCPADAISMIAVDLQPDEAVALPGPGPDSGPPAAPTRHRDAAHGLTTRRGLVAAKTKITGYATASDRAGVHRDHARRRPDATTLVRQVAGVAGGRNVSPAPVNRVMGAVNGGAEVSAVAVGAPGRAGRGGRGLAGGRARESRVTDGPGARGRTPAVAVGAPGGTGRGRAGRGGGARWRAGRVTGVAGARGVARARAGRAPGGAGGGTS